MEKSCAFTGHRPKSFPWKYNEADPRCVRLKAALLEQITALVDAGVTDFFSGMAQGVDLWAAGIVLELRAQNPALRLHCILPCREQACKWAASAQRQYHQILAQANEVVYVSQTYHSGCMLERNRYLVDHTAILLAVYNGSLRSGTGATVRYGQKLGRTVLILEPISCTAFSAIPD